MSPPRILYVDFAPMPGGSIQSLLHILRHLPRQRYHPTVLLSPTVAPLPAVRALEVPIFSYDAGQGAAIPFSAATQQVRKSSMASWLREHRWWGRPWRWGSAARRLWLRSRPTATFIANLIEDQGIDLVHLNDAIPLAEPGILAAYRRRRPSIVTVRSFHPLDDVHRLLSRLPAAGILTSRALQQDQHDQGVRFRRECIMANAIDLAQFEQPVVRTAVRTAFGLEADARIVAVVGRIMRRKGLDVFIRAMAQVVRQQPQAHGLIIGGEDSAESGLAAELQALTRQLGVADHIHFAGHRTDAPRLLLASDLLCFVPTLPEPFGRTLIEGMAAGLPVIGARSGAIPDIIVENETGLLVPPGDVDAQAQAIVQLLADPDQARALGAAGKRRAAAKYSIEQQIKQLAELYDSVIR
ncbi:MAG TPA: glycosyltransferase family 4 protein [Caldilineae bacterium]|nr:glycosyltransferase family 4 protein [Caldilineae bacterium]